MYLAFWTLFLEAWKIVGYNPLAQKGKKTKTQQRQIQNQNPSPKGRKEGKKERKKNRGSIGSNSFIFSFCRVGLPGSNAQEEWGG